MYEEVELSSRGACLVTRRMGATNPPTQWTFDTAPLASVRRNWVFVNTSLGIAPTVAARVT